jgi:hypothetical protein
MFAHHPREALQAHTPRRLRAVETNHGAAPNAHLLKNRSGLFRLFSHTVNRVGASEARGLKRRAGTRGVDNVSGAMGRRG